MSERQPNFEVGKNSEIDSKDIEKLSEKNYERLKDDAEKAKSSQESIKEIQEKIERAALSKDEIKAETEEIKASESNLRASTQLKGLAFKQRMREVQRKETPSQRTFSKFIHNPAVESVSNAAEGTVARPSGLLFGGLFSAIAGLGVLYICNHYGYEYNFTFGLASFVGGFFLGLLIEGLWRLFRKMTS